jgi:magnesium-protoporphyrin IX monomethyl ester (oxidative) cyclase
VYPIRFDRYSPYFTRAAEYGLKLAPVAFYELVYPFPREALTDLAYYFVDETADPPYSAAVRRWFDRLHTLVERWRELWTVTHTPTRPILQYESVESTVVLDSRSGGLVKHDVGDAGRSVLRGLTKARRASDLVKLLPQYDAGEIGSTLRRMRDLALLFEEGERYLSLVVVDDAEELPTWPPNKLEKRFHVVLHEWR